MKPHTFARSELVPLLKETPSPHLTITMPTRRFGKETLEGASTLRRLLLEAEEQLVAAGVDETDRQLLLAPLRELLQDRSFWSLQDAGLVLFATPDFWRSYALPYPVDTRVFLAQRFFLRQLCPLLARKERFFVIALSINHTRLIEVTTTGTKRIELPGLPTSMDDALGIDQYYSEIGIHAGGPSSLGHKGSVVHGHGDADEDRFKKDLFTYFRTVVDALRRSLPDEVPWVLATVDSYAPLFRRAAREDDRLVREVIGGNPELSSDDGLAAAARALVDTLADESRERALARLEREASSSRTIDELSAVVAAAHHGRIDSLFLASEAQHWGSWEGDRSRLEIHDPPQPGDEELIDAALFHTLRAGGQVFQVPPGALPRPAEVTALLRF